MDPRELQTRMAEIARTDRYMEAIRAVLARADLDALRLLKTSRDPDQHGQAIDVLQHNERFLSYFVAALAASKPGESP